MVHSLVRTPYKYVHLPKDRVWILASGKNALHREIGEDEFQDPGSLLLVFGGMMPSLPHLGTGCP